MIVANCPFCGKDEVSTAKTDKGWVVSCENKDCHLEVRTVGFENIHSAIAFWNWRKG